MIKDLIFSEPIAFFLSLKLRNQHQYNKSILNYFKKIQGLVWFSKRILMLLDTSFWRVFFCYWQPHMDIHGKVSHIVNMAQIMYGHSFIIITQHINSSLKYFLIYDYRHTYHVWHFKTDYLIWISNSDTKFEMNYLIGANTRVFNQYQIWFGSMKFHVYITIDDSTL